MQRADGGAEAVFVVAARLKSICRCSYAQRPARALEFQRGQALHFGSCAYPGLWLMAGKRGAGSGLHPLVEFCAGQRSVLVRIDFLETLADGGQRSGLLCAQLAVLVGIDVLKRGKTLLIPLRQRDASAHQQRQATRGNHGLLYVISPGWQSSSYSRVELLTSLDKTCSPIAHR